MNRGYLLAAILVLGSLGIAGVSGLIGFANENLLLGHRAAESEQAFELSEAGLELYELYLSHGGDAEASTTTATLYDSQDIPVGDYEVTVTPEEGGVRVVSEGRTGESTRKIEAFISQGEEVSFIYGVQAGEGGFALGNNSELSGNVYSNGDISGSNGSSIGGDAYAAGDITGVAVGGESHPGVAPRELPISGELVDEWKAGAVEKVEGDLVVGNSESLLVSGTIWVTGNLIIENGASVALSSLYGSGSGVIVADGAVTVGNGVSFSGSGEPGSYIIIVSTADSSSAISMGNNTGAVVLSAPNGTLRLDNNASVSIISAESVSLGNNAVLEYKESDFTLIVLSGGPGEWKRTSWKEIK